MNRSLSVGWYGRAFLLVICSLWCTALWLMLASPHQFSRTGVRKAMDGCCQLYLRKDFVCEISLKLELFTKLHASMGRLLSVPSLKLLITWCPWRNWVIFDFIFVPFVWVTWCSHTSCLYTHPIFSDVCNHCVHGLVWVRVLSCLVLEVFAVCWEEQAGSEALLKRLLTQCLSVTGILGGTKDVKDFLFCSVTTPIAKE